MFVLVDTASFACVLTRNTFLCEKVRQHIQVRVRTMNQVLLETKQFIIEVEYWVTTVYSVVLT